MERNNVKSIIENINKEFASELTARIGYVFGEDHIHTDENGWYYYIPAKSLHHNRPLIMHHYRGPYFVVIPWEDMKAIQAEEISVTEYIDTSVWSFGRYWGGGTMIGGGYWQILEGGTPGFTDTERIKRYMTILACRGHRVSCGYMPSDECCEKCAIEKCPFTQYAPKHEGSSWDAEVRERDARRELFNEMAKLIEARYGLKAVGCHSHEFEKSSTLLFYGYEKDTVNVYFPKELMINLLYYPEKYNIKLLAEGFDIEAAIPWTYVDRDAFVPCKHQVIHGGVNDFYEFWSQDNRFKWFEPEIEPEKEVPQEAAEPCGEAETIGAKVRACIKRVWNMITGK